MKLNWTQRISLTQAGVDTIKSVAGVYKIIHYDGDAGKYFVHYVGQTEDLNERLNQHLPENEEKKGCKEHLDNYTCYFRAAAISKQSDRDGAEVALYNYYEPSCVERVPDVEPIDINFD